MRLLVSSQHYIARRADACGAPADKFVHRRGGCVFTSAVEIFSAVTRIRHRISAWQEYGKSASIRRVTADCQILYPMSPKRSGDTGPRQPLFPTMLFSFQSAPLHFDSTPKSNCNGFYAITSRRSFPPADNLSRSGACAEATTGKRNDGSRNCPFSSVRNRNVLRSLRH
jgi:hypothetical protein